MNKFSFSKLFKNSFSNLKKVPKGLWIIIFILSLFIGVSTVSETIYETNTDTILESTLEDDFFYDSEVEDFDLYEKSSEDDYYGKNFIRTFFSEVSLVTMSVIFFGFILVSIVSLIIGYLIEFIINRYALEAIEDTQLEKTNNFAAYVLSQLYVGLINFLALTLFGVTTASVLYMFDFAASSITTASVLYMSDFAAFSITTFLVSFVIVFCIYITTKFAPMGYVAVKYNNLKTKDILSKSREISNNNQLRILGYPILYALCISVILNPLTIIVNIIISISNSTFIYIIAVLLSAIKIMLQYVLTMLFSMDLIKHCEYKNMYQEVGNIKEIVDSSEAIDVEETVENNEVIDVEINEEDN